MHAHACTAHSKSKFCTSRRRSKNKRRKKVVLLHMYTGLAFPSAEAAAAIPAKAALAAVEAEGEAAPASHAIRVNVISSLQQ